MSVLPIYATEQLGVEEYLFGLVFAVSAVMVVFFQIPVTSRTEKRKRSRVLLVGQIIGAAGFGLIFLSWDFYSLLVCVVIITVGEIVYMSIVSAIIADMSPESRRGIYMGFSGFIQTLGGGIGFLFGMWLLSVLPEQQYIWLVFSFIGLVTSVGYISLAKMIGPDRDNPHHSASVPMRPLPLEKV
jgi:MFS family permease